MRSLRADDGTRVFYCLEQAGKYAELACAPYDGVQLTGRVHDGERLRFLPPCEPTKIVAVGKNYAAHAAEMKEGQPDEPLLFLKPSSSIIADGEQIVYPRLSKRLDYEGELGVVIGRRCRHVAEDDAFSVVFGYTCLNDVTARDIQKGDPQWTRGKSFDTFCPIGPHIETELNPIGLKICTRLNGETRQSSTTDCMTYSIAKLIWYITQCMTLYPGDVIATGTPEGIGSMVCGDVVEVEIEGIGVLRNTVIAE
ncbi:MAG: fumarylacetoacetate hydrolase family protein [Clostridia bacterium]|nr:fumarylacetoacetate hydrolase family protein [Clostridia bacterium]